MSDTSDEHLSKRKRCRRFNEPGHAHALTFSCFHQQPFLSRERACRWTLEAIDKARNDHGFHLWAYVLMPEHAHLLVMPTAQDYDISRFLLTLKTSVSWRAIVHVRRFAPRFLPRMTDLQPNGNSSLRFWQRGGGYDRNLWGPRTIWDMIDYIHANPVRRGLCERPEQWPWSSAEAYLEPGAGGLSIDRSSLPEDPRF
jgi:putative transposase